MIGVQCLCGKILMVPTSAIGMAGNCPFCRQGIRLVAPGFKGSGGAFREKLVIEAGPEKVGELYPLGGPGPIEIGKLATKDIPLRGDRVSRSHCRLIRAGDGWHIEDTGSTNGIYVNAKRTQSIGLKDRDILQIGEFLLSYLVDGPWSPEQAAPLPPSGGQPAPPHPSEPPAPPKPPEPTAKPAQRVSPPPSPPSAAVAPLRNVPPRPQARVSEPAKPSSHRVLTDDDLYALSDGDAVTLVEPAKEPPPPPVLDGATCPSCKKQFPRSARICVACGVDLRTGRALLTSNEGDLDRTYTQTEKTIWWISWLLPLGLFPIASEAFGTRKPYVAWSLALLTVFFSCWFWAYEVSESPKMQSAKEYLLWTGDAKPDVPYLSWAYNFTAYGDQTAFEQAVQAFEKQKPRKGAKPLTREQILLAAHESLPERQQAFGRFHPYQLITHLFLHGDLMHLVGNLVFLLVIGSRVNALVGNSATLLVYPMLGIAAGLAQIASIRHGMPVPSLGASGAIMGLTGMYLILMPLHKVHMAAWARIAMMFIGIVPIAVIILVMFRYFLCMLFLFPPIVLLGVLMTYGLRLRLWMFAVRGFWVVLFYIAFDVFATLRQASDGVAHWAHLGGFLTGMGLGLIVLLARVVNCRGGDILSGLLGSRAYALIGRPNADRKPLLEKIW